MSQEREIIEDVGTDFINEAMNTQNSQQGSPQDSQEEASQEETSQEEASQDDQSSSSSRMTRGKQFLPTRGKLPDSGKLKIPNHPPLAAPTAVGRLRKAKKRPSTWTKEVAGLYLDCNFPDFF